MFVLGLVVGFAGGRLLHRGPFGHRFGPRPTPAALADRLGRHLDLRPAQRDSVRAILERHRPEMDSLWGAFRPRIRAVEQTVQQEIAAQLDPGQQERFAKLRRKFERMRPEPPGAGAP
jgi:hypothetical protein